MFLLIYAYLCPCFDETGSGQNIMIKSFIINIL